MKTAVRPCPICSTTTTEVLHTQYFTLPAGSPLPASYDVVACPECGFVYADTPVPQSGYDHYYAEFSKYEDPAVATGGGATSFDLQRLTTLASHIAERMPTGARILDAGCAGGGLLAALAKLGFHNLHGADAASACVAQVKNLGFAATCAPLSRLVDLKTDGRFDLIVLSHVLEHVVDLQGLMAAAASLLAPEGYIYAETPNAARYTEFPYVPFYFFDSEHINHFDPPHLAMMGAQYGLVATDYGERTLEIAPDRFYPAAWAWLRKDGRVGTPMADKSLAESVRAYIATCQTAPAYPALERLAQAGTPVIVWGAGSFAQRLFGQGALDACRVVAIVDRDRNKQGQRFGDHCVDTPEAVLVRHPDAAVLVLAAVHADDIAREARRIRADARIEILDAAPELGSSASP